MTAIKSVAGNDISALAQYLRDLFHQFARERRTALEPKWTKNLNAFRSVSDGYWKAGEAGSDGDQKKAWRSKTFVQMTKLKILSAWSMVVDILLQGGEIPFMLKPSPWDELSFDDIDPEQQKEVKKAIEDQVKIIKQELLDCNGDRELMKSVMCAAIYGETYVADFIHEVRRTGWTPQPGVDDQGQPLVDESGQPLPPQWTPYEKLVNSPAFRHCSVWSIFRDLETDNIQDGAGVFEHRLVSAFKLRSEAEKDAEIEDSILIPSAVKRVLSESVRGGGPQHGGDNEATLPPNIQNINYRTSTIENLRFWGRAPRELVEQFERDIKEFQGLDLMEEDEANEKVFDSEPEYGEVELSEPAGDMVEIFAEVAGEHIIRFSRNDLNRRPYHRVVWEISLDDFGGTGVADNVESSQLVLNGMVRAMEDNIKLAANVILAIKERYLAPGWDGKIQPGAKIPIADECDDANKAVQQIIIDSMINDLLAGIGLFERYGDEASQLPNILQGAVHDKKKPDTLGELNLLQANASKYLGGVIKNFDEGLIEPVVMVFYNWNMADASQTKGKGNFLAQALGFTSFQNRVERAEKLMKFLQIMMTHEVLFGDAKPGEISKEIGKSLDLDVEQFMKSDEEKQQAQEAAAQQQAQIMEQQMQMVAANMAKLQAEAELIRAKTDAEEVKAEAERSRIKLDRMRAVNEMEDREDRRENEAMTTLAGGEGGNGQEKRPGQQQGGQA